MDGQSGKIREWIKSELGIETDEELIKAAEDFDFLDIGIFTIPVGGKGALGDAS